MHCQSALPLGNISRIERIEARVALEDSLALAYRLVRRAGPTLSARELLSSVRGEYTEIFHLAELKILEHSSAGLRTLESLSEGTDLKRLFEELRGKTTRDGATTWGRHRLIALGTRLKTEAILLVIHREAADSVSSGTKDALQHLAVCLEHKVLEGQKLEEAALKKATSEYAAILGEYAVLTTSGLAGIKRWVACLQEATERQNELGSTDELLAILGRASRIVESLGVVINTGRGIERFLRDMGRILIMVSRPEPVAIGRVLQDIRLIVDSTIDEDDIIYVDEVQSRIAMNQIHHALETATAQHPTRLTIDYACKCNGKLSLLVSCSSATPKVVARLLEDACRIEGDREMPRGPAAFSMRLAANLIARSGGKLRLPGSHSREPSLLVVFPTVQGAGKETHG